MKFARILMAVALAAAVSSCSHESLTPNSSDVKASKDEPSSDCVMLSEVAGSTKTAKGTSEEALEDMKKETSSKGGNYVRIQQYSSYGTSVTGTAYRCK
jgi:FlaG/FlaF family flagellin (archaellin)